MADIFLSYSSSDRDLAISLAKGLETLGWTVWWDRKTPIGKSHHDVLEEEIDAAKCVVVVWTQNSVSSDWVRSEADEGRRRGILVPAIVGQPRIPLAFRALQAADLGAWEAGAHSSEFDALVSSITRIVPPRLPGKGGSTKESVALALPHQLATSIPVQKSSKPRVVEKRAPNAAFTKPLTPSTSLAAIVGKDPLPRTEVISKLWAYIKRNRLQDHANKRMVNTDDKLRAIFDGKAQVSMFEMAGLIGKHVK